MFHSVNRIANDPQQESSFIETLTSYFSISPSTLRMIFDFYMIPYDFLALMSFTDSFFSWTNEADQLLHHHHTEAAASNLYNKNKIEWNFIGHWKPDHERFHKNNIIAIDASHYRITPFVTLLLDSGAMVHLNILSLEPNSFPWLLTLTQKWFLFSVLAFIVFLFFLEELKPNQPPPQNSGFLFLGLVYVVLVCLTFGVIFFD